MSTDRIQKAKEFVRSVNDDFQILDHKTFPEDFLIELFCTISAEFGEQFAKLERLGAQPMEEEFLEILGEIEQHKRDSRKTAVLM